MASMFATTAERRWDGRRPEPAPGQARPASRWDVSARAEPVQAGPRPAPTASAGLPLFLQPKMEAGRTAPAGASGGQSGIAVGRPGDAFERQADAVADQVTGHSGGYSHGPSEARAEHAGLAPRRSVPASLPGIASNGSPLPHSEQGFFAGRFDRDLSGVRVHTDSAAAAAAGQLHAQAFTYGQDIYFGAGRWSPGSTGTRRLLAHELTHVAQQTGSGVNGQEAAPPAIQRAPDPQAEGQTPVSPCEEIRQLTSGALPGLLKATGRADTQIGEMGARRLTPDEFKALSGVDASQLPENTFVGGDRVSALNTGLNVPTPADLVQRGLPAAGLPAALNIPLPMTMIPKNSVGILWTGDHLSVFANVDGALTVRGFRGSVWRYLGESLPGEWGLWFTEQLLRGIPGEMMNDQLFAMMGDQAVIFRETSPDAATDFAEQIKAAEYKGTYRYSPPRSGPEAGKTEALMHRRIYEAKGEPQAIMCTNNCITTPAREIEAVLGMHPKRGGVDLVTGQAAGGGYDPYMHGKAKGMTEYMKEPNLAEGMPGLQSMRVTPGAAKAIGYMRVGGAIMMIYGVWETGKRIYEADKDDLPLVIAQEAFTWGGAIWGSAVGGAAGGAIACSPTGPVDLVCAAGGFLGGLIVGTAGAALGSLLMPVAIAMAIAPINALIVTMEITSQMAQIPRGISEAWAGQMFHNIYAQHSRLNPCNWNLEALPQDSREDVAALGYRLWKTIGPANANRFLDLYPLPLSSFDRVNLVLLDNIARDIMKAVGIMRTPFAMSGMAIAGLTPLQFVDLMKNLGLLKFRYDPDLLATIWELPDEQ